MQFDVSEVCYDDRFRPVMSSEIVDICRRYQVEQLLLYPKMAGTEWSELFKDDSMVYEDKDYALYVAKRLGWK